MPIETEEKTLAQRRIHWSVITPPLALLFGVCVIFLFSPPYDEKKQAREAEEQAERDLRIKQKPFGIFSERAGNPYSPRQGVICERYQNYEKFENTNPPSAGVRPLEVINVCFTIDGKTVNSRTNLGKFGFRDNVEYYADTRNSLKPAP